MALDFGLLGAPQDMTASTNAGFDRGMQMAMLQKAQEDKAAQLEVQKAQQLAQQELMTKALGGDVMAQSQYAAMHAKSADDANKAFSTLGNPEREARKTEAYQIDNLARVNPVAAKQMLNDKLTALGNSDQKDPKIQQQIANIKALTLIPDHALPTITASMVHMADPENAPKYFESISQRELQPGLVKLGNAKAAVEGAKAQYAGASEQAGLAKLDADINNIRSQVAERSARLTLDRDTLNFNMDKAAEDLKMKLQKSADLTPEATKLITESTIASAAAKSEGDSMQALADKIDVAAKKGEIGSGWTARTGELWANLAGREDYITDLRKEYTRLRAQGVIKSLPPGPASDKDIQLAGSGFLSDTANPTEIASFLRGMSKIRNFESGKHQTQADWAQANGSIGRATKDITIDGRTYPKGSAISDAFKNAGSPVVASGNMQNLLNKYGQ
jgi:hypothetical protein